MSEAALKRKGVNRAITGSVSAPAETALLIIVGLFAFICVIPFIFTIIISFSAEESIRTIGFSFVPAKWSLNAYKYVFEMGDLLWRSYFNSFFTTIVGTGLSVLICILYSYALFRVDFRYRTFFTFFSFFTMMFGGGLAPTYMICKNLLGLNDNYAALIVPLLVNPFNFIIMRTFFKTSVPDALIESASIDGSGEYRTLFQIVIPVALPGIATVSLLTMLAYWNEWFVALLYIGDNKLIPLQYLLMKLQAQADFLARGSSQVSASATNLMTLPTQTLRMALVSFIVLPIACAYPFFQRYIISGLTIGAVKG